MRRLVSVFAVAIVLVGAMAFPAFGAAPSAGAPVLTAAGPIPAPHAGPAKPIARVIGGGTAIMTDNGGDSAFWFSDGGITLYSDGSAKGTVFCADESPPTLRAMIYGEVTSWTLDDGLISLHVPVNIITSIDIVPVFPDFAGDPFRIQIQTFGGARVGHWTLDNPGPTGGTWITFCLELVTTGEITLVVLGRDEGDGQNNDH